MDYRLALLPADRASSGRGMAPVERVYDLAAGSNIRKAPPIASRIRGRSAPRPASPGSVRTSRCQFESASRIATTSQPRSLATARAWRSIAHAEGFATARLSLEAIPTKASIPAIRLTTPSVLVPFGDTTRSNSPGTSGNLRPRVARCPRRVSETIRPRTLHCAIEITPGGDVSSGILGRAGVADPPVSYGSSQNAPSTSKW